MPRRGYRAAGVSGLARVVMAPLRPKRRRMHAVGIDHDPPGAGGQGGCHHPDRVRHSYFQKGATA
jgi:hypothetical protein